MHGAWEQIPTTPSRTIEESVGEYTLDRAIEATIFLYDLF